MPVEHPYNTDKIIVKTGMQTTLIPVIFDR